MSTLYLSSKRMLYKERNAVDAITCSDITSPRVCTCINIRLNDLLRS